MQTVSSLVDAIVDRWSARENDDTQAEILNKKALAELRENLYSIATLAVEVERGRYTPCDDSPEPLFPEHNTDPRIVEIQTQALEHMQKLTAQNERILAAQDDAQFFSDANAALNGLLVNDDDGVFGGPRDVAKLAYDIADAMREERERRKAVRP